MSQKTFIFDFDGTIIDSFDDACKIVEKYTKKYSKEKPSLKEIKYLYKNKSIFDLMLKFNIKKWQIPILFYKISKEFKSNIEKSKSFDHIKPVLKKLKKENFKLIILSSNNKKDINQFLKKENLLEVFDEIHTSRFPLKKNKNLNKIIKKNNLDKNNTFYVGDEIRDIIASQKSKIKIIAVSWGFNSKKLLSQFNPDFIIEKPQEIILIANS